jgi:hypothetical protein
MQALPLWLLRVVGKHPTARITDVLHSAAAACPKFWN